MTINEMAEKAASVEELLALAKEAGIEMSDTRAKELFAEYHESGELADQELKEVSGGIQAGRLLGPLPGEFAKTPKPQEKLKLGIIKIPPMGL